MFFLRRLRREMSHGAIKTGLTHIIKHTLSPLLYITFHNIIPTVVTQHELYSRKWSKCILLPYSENWKMISNRADYDTLHKHFAFSCYCFKYSLFIGNVKKLHVLWTVQHFREFCLMSHMKDLMQFFMSFNLSLACFVRK